MLQNTKKYIITGAPGTGKTTLINLLKKEVLCMDEVSRQVIIAEQKKGSNGVPWENIQRFTKLVYQQSIEALEIHKEAVFCDRSLLDLIAYLDVARELIPDYLNDFPYKDKFHTTVFFAPTWQDIYCKDAQRLQEFNYCKKLEKSLLEQYKKKGFNIVILPKSSPSTRVKFVLTHIL